MMYDLWTPTGAAYRGAAHVGYNKETGSAIVAHTYSIWATDQFGTKRDHVVKVLADKDMSQAHIEDMMANAAEKWFKTVREKYDKRPATPAELKHAGKAMNDVLKYRTRRRESTSGKIYF